MRTTSIVFVGAAVLFLFIAGAAWSAEQRCMELGAACACSEPLNNPTYAVHANGSSWRPTTNISSKPCSAEVVGYPVARNGPVFGTNDSAVLGALPPGNSVSYVLWAGNNNIGIFWLSNNGATTPDCAVGFERCEFRWYLYKSTNFESTDGSLGGTCTGDKHAQVNIVNPVPGLDFLIVNPSQVGTGSGMAMYNFLPSNGWNLGGDQPDCCGDGPRATGDTFIDGRSQRGKWFRFSHVVRNPSGGSGASRLGLEIYAKNVTDNGPEVKILDIRGGIGSGFNPWTGPYNTIIPPNRIQSIAVDGYRQGTCAGFEAYSHFIVAHWPTDAGQRIGAAYEIEGGSLAGPAPAPPPSVNVK